jgi:hypothetical protein
VARHCVLDLHFCASKRYTLNIRCRSLAVLINASDSIMVSFMQHFDDTDDNDDDDDEKNDEVSFIM